MPAQGHRVKRSARFGKLEESASAASLVGKTRSFASANNRQQPGDPAKLAEALLQLVALPDPPVRLPLGPDALKRIAAKNEFVNQEMERWKTLSTSTSLSWEDPP